MGFFTQTVGIDPAFERDFEGLRAKGYPKAQEQMGMVSWTGGRLPFVPVGGANARPAPPLDAKVLELIQHSWKVAVRPDPRAPRRGPNMGGHRPQRPANRDEVYNPVAAFDYKGKLGPAYNLTKHLQDTFPRDWSIMRDIPMVSAYGFRGDGRPPSAIQASQGFRPPITRTDQSYVQKTMFPIFQTYLKNKTGQDIALDQFEAIVRATLPSGQDQRIVAYYGLWRALVDRESLHLGRMLASEDMKGYISTTKAVQVAKGFAGMADPPGYVYAMRVRSGFHVPARNAIGWTELFGEEEIASPFEIPWEDVMGWRRVGSDKKFTGPVVLRRDFRMLDPDAATEVFELLSGKPQ